MIMVDYANLNFLSLPVHGVVAEGVLVLTVDITPKFV